MKNVYYITFFRRLAILEPILGYIELLPGVNVTNDKRVKEQLVTTEFADAAGLIEMSREAGDVAD
jgi:hypothetical protein